MEALTTQLRALPAGPSTPDEPIWPLHAGPSADETITVAGHRVSAALVTDVIQLRDKPNQAIKRVRAETSTKQGEASDIIEAIFEDHY